MPALNSSRFSKTASCRLTSPAKCTPARPLGQYTTLQSVTKPGLRSVPPQPRSRLSPYNATSRPVVQCARGGRSFTCTSGFTTKWGWASAAHCWPGVAVLGNANWMFVSLDES